ncbi:flagellar FliJ family protein [Ruminococcaceae bacterium OttesenSCG-928-O06]|nr:flagellar FliJ family protein [Ruminococcaceae bacterium OttesenSCG-928-O06]
MLAFKRTMYEKERNTLAQLRAERYALQSRRDETERQMLQRQAEFQQKAAAGAVGIEEVKKTSFYRENAHNLILQLEGETAQKDIEIERQMQVVIELDKEVKSLEKLRERQWEEYQADSMREENERILEIVSGRFVEKQREGDEAQ